MKNMKVRGISYAGCGFKGTYHFGATAALKDHLGLGSSPSPIILFLNIQNRSISKDFNELHFSGTSAGAMGAVKAALWHGKGFHQL